MNWNGAGRFWLFVAYALLMALAVVVVMAPALLLPLVWEHPASYVLASLWFFGAVTLFMAWATRPEKRS